MMPYKGFYWHFFAPMMKHSIAKRFSPELAEKSGISRASLPRG